MTLDELIDRLERLGVRRAYDGNFTDQTICDEAVRVLKHVRTMNAQRGRRKSASPEIVAEIRKKVGEFMPNGMFWGIAELARHFRLSEQTVRNIVERKGAYKK